MQNKTYNSTRLARLQDRSIYKYQLYFYMVMQILKLKFKNSTVYNSNKNMKYLRINLAKYVQDLYNK